MKFKIVTLIQNRTWRGEEGFMKDIGLYVLAEKSTKSGRLYRI